ncbi:hypothetical protein ON010_g6429 [Phytophthora cinnamomi]|nr:hypothetical protein ON010_g6429 [Phytophthora cinnamomi]
MLVSSIGGDVHCNGDRCERVELLALHVRERAARAALRHVPKRSSRCNAREGVDGVSSAAQPQLGQEAQGQDVVISVAALRRGQLGGEGAAARAEEAAAAQGAGHRSARRRHDGAAAAQLLQRPELPDAGQDHHAGLREPPGRAPAAGGRAAAARRERGQEAAEAGDVRQRLGVWGHRADRHPAALADREAGEEPRDVAAPAHEERPGEARSSLRDATRVIAHCGVLIGSVDVGDQVTVFVYVSVKAFDVFKEGDANFHLSDQLYNLLQMVNAAEAPSLDALASRSTTETEDPSSQVNPEDLDTLFSECVGANDLHNSADGSDTDPSEHLVQHLNAIELRDHQKQALRWMLWRENQLKNGVSEQESNDPMWEERHFRSRTSYYVNPFEKSASLTRPDPPAPCLGGILADDMGMGKTMMMLSLIAYQKHVGEEKSAGETNDLPSRDKRKSTGKTLVVCPLSLLHQWKNEAHERFLPNTLSVYVYYGDDRDNGTGLTSASFCKNDLVLTTYGVLSAEFEKDGILVTTEWNRVILDEAHSIKNRSTGYFKTCSAMKATHRWCLTGTPIQNTLDDMFSLLCFLQYQPWSRLAWWKRVITKPYEEGDDVNALGRLKVILTPILLRRTKHSRDKQGKMIVQLPPKHVDLVQLEFSLDERAFYQAVYDKSRAEFNGFVASGSAMTSYVAIFALLLRLRQACDHPLLALGKDFEQALKPDDNSADAAPVITARSAFQPQQNESSEAYYQRIAAQLQKDMQASNRTQLLENGSGSSDKDSSSAGGLTTSYIQSVIAQVEDGLESQECPICLDPPQNAVLTPCAHVLCDQCLRDSLANDPENGCPVCRTVVDLVKVFKLPPPGASKALEDDCKTGNATDRDGAPDDRRSAATDDDGTGFESAKLQQLLSDLKAVKLENESAESPDQRRKVVVFSQWTSMLDMPGAARARADQVRQGPERGGADHQPQGRWRGAQPHVRVRGDPAGPVVEPGRGGPGRGPRAPPGADAGRAGQALRGEGHGGGHDPAAAAAQGEAGQARAGGREGARRAPQRAPQPRRPAQLLPLTWRIP